MVINRNCMSMEMEVLSHEAVEQADKDKDRIYIGYLSGSKTHDQDFVQVEAALLEVMERHPEVYLKLVGVLDESGMEPVQNRIEKASVYGLETAARSDRRTGYQPDAAGEQHCSTAVSPKTSGRRQPL